MTGCTLPRRIARLPRVPPRPARPSQRHASTSTAPSDTPSSDTPSDTPSAPAPPAPTPITPASLVLGPTHANRFAHHYHHTLAPALLYLLYDPAHTPAPDPASFLPQPDPANPYAANRPTPAPKGGHAIRPNAKPIAPDTIPRIDKIVLHTFVRPALQSKQQLVPALAAFRAITGSTKRGGNVPGQSGVLVVRSRKSAAPWRLRPNVPCAVKAELRGEQMWTFLQTLGEFVVPRLRDFDGFLLPSAASSPNTPDNLSGTVQMGFAPVAMGLFPQIEVNFDAYARMYGFHVQIVTNQKGKGAQDRARALVSGFRIPFARRVR